jgi:hypothetical protein
MDDATKLKLTVLFSTAALSLLINMGRHADLCVNLNLTLISVEGTELEAVTGHCLRVFGPRLYFTVNDAYVIRTPGD